MTETTVYENDHIKITLNPGSGKHDEEYRLYSGFSNTLYGDNDFLDKDDMDALRAYFQAEEDKRLNRWRHPHHPDIYVRPMNGNPDIVGVVKDDEAGLSYDQRTRGMGVSVDPMTIVAHAYFEAHPESKPWHVAKEGEAWVVTTFNKAEPALVTKTPGVDGLRFRSLDYNIPVESKTITEAYRIFSKDAF